ncbi:hypothetical protein PYW08_011971 [Mythimna loreyi]|uniref:Uncharacterized protein n=1 Tax=Mythimna loreyi TaxID=667449 RepID=A0ACC2QPX9_9NEOP|nr:hypothetical protein PYW08_011971 [Mythimna loreyi]
MPQSKKKRAKIRKAKRLEKRSWAALFDKPVPVLKTIPLIRSSSYLVARPPEPEQVNLFNDSPPHIPSINTEVSSTNSTAETNTNTESNSPASTEQENSEEMKKKKNKNNYARRVQAALDRMQLAGKIDTQGAAQGADQTSIQGTSQISMQAAPQTSGQLSAQTSEQVTAQTATSASAPTPPATEPVVQPIQMAPNVYILPPNYKMPEQSRPFTNQQKKKWLKFQKKIENRKNIKAIKLMAQSGGAKPPETTPEETQVPETSQDGSPSVVGQTSDSPSSVSTDGSNQGPTAPIFPKTNITLKTKKSLQQDVLKQRINWIKPTESEPGTSATASQVSPQTTEVPKATSSVKPLPGSTIPILENRTVEPTPRSSAGSFFKKAAPSQPQPSVPRVPNHHVGDPFALTYKYPKGIPRSFLLQQEKSLEPTGSPITADSPIWPSNPMMNTGYPDTIILGPQTPNTMTASTSPILVQTDDPIDVQQPYSPSDIYSEQASLELPEGDAELTEQNQPGQKRLSAFQRLGPVTQPKKPKITINLNLTKDQPVREVVNETDDDPEKYTPVHLRKDMLTSTDETVMRFLPAWPWRKNVAVRRSATARTSRSVMILEQEKMEEAYEKENIYIQISVKGYPSTWTKERVLDAVLESVKGYSLIPCFAEFTQHECKFLVLRSRSALIVLHKTGFYIHKDGVELTITISLPVLNDKLDFIPRIVLRKRIIMSFMDRKVNLSAFTMQDDISHFIYFPLNRVVNQRDCIHLQTSIDWNRLVDLDLSHNRLTTLSGFDLINVTPNLKHLNLSHNCLEKITVLLNDRLLPLKTIHLEGNPLCHDYIDPEHYVKVIRMLFPAVVEIDGVPVHRKGELPAHKQNYCPEDAQEVTEKFLEIFFPLLDSGSEHRSLLQEMYEEDAMLTVTYCYKLRYSQIYRNYRNLFLYARFLDEGETDTVVGAMAITKLLNRWPQTEHDPLTFSVDTLYHTETTTILRVSGILKLTSESLAEDEHLLSFTRTVVLHSEDGAEYKIQNEMVYWSEPPPAAARLAFRVNTVPQKNSNLKIEATTDEDLRDKYLKIFMKMTTMDKKICERCLEVNDWNFKLALEHFTKLLKLNNLDSLTQEVQVAT